jgi:hypothetical protein
MALSSEHPYCTTLGWSSELPCTSASDWYARYVAQLSSSTFNTVATVLVDSRATSNPNVVQYVFAQSENSIQFHTSISSHTETKSIADPQAYCIQSKSMMASILYQAPVDIKAQQPKLEFSNGGFSGEVSKDTIQLVSLGCACGPKLAFKEMGRGAETLPFDWITTTSDGVLGFLKSGFHGFFDFERKVEKDGGGIKITAFRSKYHGFWHDDPTLDETHEKYHRRFARMLSIDTHKQPVLFVRLAATSEEIRTVDQFLGQLTSQFGPHAYLLLIIDCQGANACGPCLVKGLDNLLIHYLEGGNGVTKFCEPVDNALGWVANKQTQCAQVEDLAAALNLARPVTPGYYGMGGMPAFEGVPEIF